MTLHADRAASLALQMDLDGSIVIGTSLEVLVTIMDQGDCLREFFASIPAGGGPTLEFTTVARLVC